MKDSSINTCNLLFGENNTLIGSCENGYKVVVHYKIGKIVKILGDKSETLDCGIDFTLFEFIEMLNNLSKEDFKS